MPESPPRCTGPDASGRPRSRRSLRDARTGQTIWRVPNGRDVGNCLALDVDAAAPGHEFFGASSIGLHDTWGRWLGIARNRGAYYQTLRMAIWWRGDMGRDLLPGSDGVWQYSVRWRNTGLIAKFEDCESNNHTNSVPT